MSGSDMKIWIGIVLLVITCVLAQENGTPPPGDGDMPPPHGNGTMRPPPGNGTMRPPPEGSDVHCFTNLSRVACEDKKGKWNAERNQCCFEKYDKDHDDMEKDDDSDDDDDKSKKEDTDFNSKEEGSDMHCFTNLSRIACEDKKGKWMAERNQCCFEKYDKAHTTDDKEKDDDSDDDDDKSKEEDTDDNSKEEGSKVRCTRKKCDMQKESPCGKGVCMRGVCCYKPTEKEAHSLCKERAGGQNGKSNEHINCTSGGSFWAKCSGNSCQCLNASSGQPVGSKQTVPPNKNISCDEVQKQSQAARINLTFTATSKSYESFTTTDLDELESQANTKTESLVPVVVVRATTSSGSVVVTQVIQYCEADCAATANTSDLYSLANEVVTQIEQGNVVFNINGETSVASNPRITDITSVAALEAMQEEMPEPTKNEEDKTELIIIVVLAVTVVVVMVTLGVVCYFYSRANKARTKQAHFSDLTGHVNQMYMKA